MLINREKEKEKVSSFVHDSTSHSFSYINAPTLPIFLLSGIWNSSGALRLLSLFNVILLFLVTDNWSNISRKSFRAIKLRL